MAFSTGPNDFRNSSGKSTETQNKEANAGPNEGLIGIYCFFAGVHFADAVLDCGCVAPARGVFLEEDFFEYGMVSGCWVEFL